MYTKIEDEEEEEKMTVGPDVYPFSLCLLCLTKSRSQIEDSPGHHQAAPKVFVGNPKELRGVKHAPQVMDNQPTAPPKVPA